ncbi:MAG: endonuclease V [Candidatus Bathyarchaeales archaeon]
MYPTKIPKNFSVKKAHNAQLLLSKKILQKDLLPKKIRYIAGIDVAYSEQFSIGAVAVLDYKSLSLKEFKTTLCKTRFPYIPTLLSFREVQPAVTAIDKLKLDPAVFLVDGQGIMHPYRLGFAAHLGLVIARPTIGVAKSPLCGKVQAFTNDDWAPIIDKHEVIGAAVITKKGRKPVYVSVGNMVSLKTAISIVKYCTKTNRIPEPLLQAHRIATEEKRKTQNTFSYKNITGDERIG